MNNFALSFSLGLLCTATVFALCFIIVIGSKIIWETLKRYLPEKKVEPAPKQEVKPKKPREVKSPIVRSIEIDPSEIDRIYVKKSS